MRIAHNKHRRCCGKPAQTRNNMGAGFDEMHERSHAYHPSVPPAAQRNRLLLNAIMTGGGFVGISSEWWHFELPQAASYPLLADQFTCFISPGTQHVS